MVQGCEGVPVRVCALCEYAATYRCDECEGLVCPAHCKSITVPMGRKEGYIIQYRCDRCTPEAKEARSKKQQAKSDEKQRARRTRRMARLNDILAEPTTSDSARRQAQLEKFYLAYGWAILNVLMAIFIALIFGWAMGCAGAGMIFPEARDDLYCAWNPLIMWAGVLHGM